MTTAWRIADGVSVATTDYGAVLLDQRRGRYWQLNPTAATAVTALAAGGTTSEAVARLQREYAVDAERAAADVAALVDELRRARLLEADRGAP
jgi:hypothetical protein